MVKLILSVGGGTGQYTYNWSASNNGAGIVNGQQDQTGLKCWNLHGDYC